MSDDEFNSLCNAHGFGAVASGECPLVSSGMLKVLVDAAYQAGQKAADGQIKALRFILREVLENDSYESLHNNAWVQRAARKDYAKSNDVIAAPLQPIVIRFFVLRHRRH